jgi:hypothetical protein
MFHGMKTATNRLSNQTPPGGHRQKKQRPHHENSRFANGGIGVSFRPSP